jgi:hypothetical protein
MRMPLCTGMPERVFVRQLLLSDRTLLRRAGADGGQQCLFKGTIGGMLRNDTDYVRSTSCQAT